MLRNILILASTLAVALGSAVPAAHAADLWQVWQLATQNDPAFKQARANRNASMEARPLAWSKLFPSIDLTANRAWNNDTSSSTALNPYGQQGVVSRSQAQNYRQDGWGATLTQTLFNWQQFQAVQTSGYTVGQARADYEVALQGLIVSVSQAYFNVLNAKDLLNADRANLKALHRQYQQSEQKYKVGLVAVTGVRQSQAAYEQARAQAIVDRQSLAQAREALRAITGRYLPKLEPPRRNLPLLPPMPANVQNWVRTGFANSPGLASAKFAQKVQDNLVDEQRSGYMPTVNLQVSHNYGYTNGNSSLCEGSQCIPAQPDQGNSYANQIGLNLSWNIFQGGGTRDLVKQQQYRADSAMAAEIAERRTVEQNVRNAYLAVISDIAQVQATKQAVVSARTALKATLAGLRVGTQTTIDVLTSRENLLTAQKSFFNARYGYLIAVLQLEQAAGTVTPDDLKRLNALLVPAGSAAAPNPLSAPIPATATP